MLEFRLLGQFSVVQDGQPKDIPSRAAQSLLAYLLLNPSNAHRREKLAGLFWPDQDESSARRNLRQALWLLRKAVGSSSQHFLQSDDLSISLNTNQIYWLDVAVLEQKTTANAPIEELATSTAVYLGELLPGFFDEWVPPERERLQVIFDQKMNILLDHLVADRQWTKTIEQAERWIHRGFAPEKAYCALMTAHHGLGDLSSVRVDFQRCKENLQREWGAEPSDTTRELFEQLIHSQGLKTREISPIFNNLEPEEGRPPFKGLRFFEENDADLFSGREVLSARLITRLCQPGLEGSLLFVIGASGSGKSSLLRAGILPVLRSGQPMALVCPMPKGSPGWPVFLTSPAAHPLESLAAILTQDSESVLAAASLADDMAQDPRGLRLYAQKLIHKIGGQDICLLIILDHFEELFTLCKDDKQRLAFIENLLNAVDSGFVKVIAALRADFYGHLAPYRRLREALLTCQVYIGPMEPAELRQAIEEPAAKGGWLFEPGLVDLILRDLGVGSDPSSTAIEPGALPLLSHALLETWYRRQGRTMTLAGYAGAGGVRGAIARSAETVYQSLSGEQQKIARQIFLHLTELGENNADRDYAPLNTRRRVSITQLTKREETADEVLTVLNLLADARLITITSGEAEVSHEALIREWPTFRRWLSDDRENLRIHRRLTAAAQAWQLANCDPGELLHGARLVQVLEWAAGHSDDLSSIEQEYLEVSRQAAAQEEFEREAQRQREMDTTRQLAELETRRASEQTQSNRRLRKMLAGLAIILLLAVVFAGVAVTQRNQAEQQRRLATSRELAASAISNLSVDPESSILLAIRAASTEDTPESEDALHWAVQESRVIKTLHPDYKIVSHAAFSPDGEILATSGENPGGKPQTDLWDLETGKRLLELNGQLAVKSWIDRLRLPTVTVGEGGNTQIALWDTTDGYSLSSETLPIPFAQIVRIEMNSLLTRVVMNLQNGTTLVYDLETKQLLLKLGQAGQDSAFGAAFSPNSQELVTTVNNLTGLWDIQSGRQIAIYPSQSFGADTPVFSPDGSRVAYSLGSLVKIVDAASGKELLTLSGHTGWVYAITFSAKGDLIATGASDSTASIWDVTSGRLLFTMAGHNAAVGAVELSKYGSRLVTAGFDGTVRLWNFSPAGNGENFSWYNLSHKPYNSIAFSQDGKKIVATGGDQAGDIWDVASGNRLITLRGISKSQGSAAYRPDGQVVAVSSTENQINLLDANSGGKLQTLDGHTDWVGKLVFNPNGTLLASISFDKTIKIWDAVTGQLKKTIPAYTEAVDKTQILGLAFSPDGKFIAGSSAQTVKMWDVATGKEVLRLPTQEELVYSVAFSPDGKKLAIGLALGRGASIWEISTAKKLAALTGQRGSIQGLVFSRDGRTLYSGSVDGTIKVWDVATGRDLMTLARQKAQITDIALNSDGSLLAASSDDGTIHVYQLHINDLLALAANRLTRSLTAEECQKYLHTNTCPAPLQ